MMILAEVPSTVPASVTANWAWGLAGFAVLLGGVFWCWNQIRQALGKQTQTISPQPLMVATPEQFAKQKEFEVHMKDNNDKFEKLATQRDDDLRNAALARKEMHKDIQKVGVEVAALTNPGVTVMAGGSVVTV